MLTVKPQPVPLQKADDGTWRVGDTRVLFDLVVYAFNTGRTPGEIVQSYDTLQLENVYAVIAYYLASRSEVDDLLLIEACFTAEEWVDMVQDIPL